jgi:hypothetical protein
MHTTLAVIAGLIGVTIIALTTASALQTFVVPRGTSLLLTRWVLPAVRAVFILSMRHLRDYSTRDRVMAMFAPTIATVRAEPARTAASDQRTATPPHVLVGLEALVQRH